MNQVIAACRGSNPRLIDRQLLPFLQKKRLHKSRRRHFELRRTRREHDRPAVSHLHLDV